ncbi:MAG: ribonuclease HI [Desulfobacter sp.]|nr:ribonuclease HI [Desulfobacter sp.]WDP85804.1 MAG: ribonuclease HI [Desulfobacter sp.]
MKFYAVAKGRKTGIFTSWPEAEQQVKGVAEAKYKSFKNRQDAEQFLKKPHYGPSKQSKKKPASAGPFSYPENTIVVYTDGGAIGNPGPGGYGVVFKEGKQLSGGFNLTTNNRMELMGVIAALESLQGETRPIVLHSDSRYVLNGITKGWAKAWKKRGWKKSDGTPALNPDLWARLLALLPGLEISFKWVKGHAGDPLNEACDQLANSTARQKKLGDDKAYLNTISSLNSALKG